MKYEYYEAIVASDNSSVYKFVSTGKNGNIRKVVYFRRTEKTGVYNMTLANVNHLGYIDDETLSNNGDRDKILATIFWIVEKYTRRFPGRWIYFTGNSKARTRLYRMAISLNMAEIFSAFDVFSDVGEFDFVPFAKDLDAMGFLVKRKMWK